MCLSLCVCVCVYARSVCRGVCRVVHLHSNLLFVWHSWGFGYKMGVSTWVCFAICSPPDRKQLLIQRDVLCVKDQFNHSPLICAWICFKYKDVHQRNHMCALKSNQKLIRFILKA